VNNAEALIKDMLKRKAGEVCWLKRSMTAFSVQGKQKWRKDQSNAIT
jgi:hypothetical protein